MWIDPYDYTLKSIVIQTNVMSRSHQAKAKANRIFSLMFVAYSLIFYTILWSHSLSLPLSHWVEQGTGQVLDWNQNNGSCRVRSRSVWMDYNHILTYARGIIIGIWSEPFSVTRAPEAPDSIVACVLAHVLSALVNVYRTNNQSISHQLNVDGHDDGSL